MGPHPAVAAVRNAVRAAVADLPCDALVLVACSGGPDSLALAAGAAFVAPRMGLRAGAVVVDHGLQAGSAGVAARAAEQCRALGLDPVQVVALDLAGRGGPGGPEAVARDARHAALTARAEALGAVAVLLGHTRDDQAETVLLRLARGSGARSLAGIPPRRGLLRRPLLDLSRADTEAACAVLGLEVWHDPTNRPPQDAVACGGGRRPLTDVPRRSLVRHQVLPLLEEVLGPGVRGALARSAELLREDADALDALAADLLEEATTPDGPPGAVVLDVDTLAQALPAVRRRAVRAAALRAGAAAGDLSRTHVLRLDALLTSWSGQGPVALPGGVVGRRRYGRLILAGEEFAGDEQEQ